MLINRFPKSVSVMMVLLMVLLSCKENHAPNEINKDQNPKIETPKEYALVIHGGAGTILKSDMSAEKEADYRAKLQETLEIGQKILAKGGSALEAVEQTIRNMENSPLFNAGKGAVFTNSGKNELDASIMDGSSLNAGAVAGVTTIKNPISAARAVMEKSDHVLLSGKGAEGFAKSAGLESAPSNYFYTKARKDALERTKRLEKSSNTNITRLSEDKKHGTVGAVALDKDGNIVAGTSTGGMTNKRYGRVGDSPIIGAGTYADSKVCGISCTGHGEYFIRYAVAHDIYALMAYKGLTLAKAADHVVHQKLAPIEAGGGIIALDRLGNVSMTFNTAGMYRGFIIADSSYVGIYDE